MGGIFKRNVGGKDWVGNENGLCVNEHTVGVQQLKSVVNSIVGLRAFQFLQ